MKRPLARRWCSISAGSSRSTLFETHDLTEQALGLPPCTLKWLGPLLLTAIRSGARCSADDISERDYWLTRSREVGHMLGEDWQRHGDLRAARARRRSRNRDSSRGDRAIRMAARTPASSSPSCRTSSTCSMAPTFRHRLPILRVSMSIVDATHTGILKPDPRAYSVLRSTGAAAEDCVFVDDQTPQYRTAPPPAACAPCCSTSQSARDAYCGEALAHFRATRTFAENAET